MTETGQAKLLRAFIGEQDKVEGQPLHEAIVTAALEHQVAGVTVLRGVESYGATHRRHTAKVLRLSENLPLVVEMVDVEERIRTFLPLLDALMDRSGGGGLVTLEQVEVLRYPPKG
ncbi:MAG: DUF190 domain-containing protein [Deltaproteobacteria bacterium]|nr:DUF190 domain-containing protein [Deltaproteobacteria bacterium]